MNTTVHNQMSSPKVQVIENVLPVEEAESAMMALRPDGGEIEYGQYYALTDNNALVRLPRLMAFQASANPSGDFPWYRCTMSSVPQNKIVYQPWTSTIERIKTLIEKMTGDTWNLAHIIYYKDGDESMGMHSDTILDLAAGSKIAVFSLGSTRQLDLLKKNKSTLDGAQEMKLDLPGNSLFLLDEETNRHYVHGIRKQKKNQVEDRVAIVFRHVLTYKANDGTFYGNGSVYATKEEILQRTNKLHAFKSGLSCMLGMMITMLTTADLAKSPVYPFLVATVYMLSIYLLLVLIERFVRRHTDQKQNARLQKLCQMKNFQAWDLPEMRQFLKYGLIKNHE
jgi:hypothetical protein